MSAVGPCYLLLHCYFPDVRLSTRTGNLPLTAAAAEMHPKRLRLAPTGESKMRIRRAREEDTARIKAWAGLDTDQHFKLQQSKEGSRFVKYIMEGLGDGPRYMGRARGKDDLKIVSL